MKSKNQANRTAPPEEVSRRSGGDDVQKPILKSGNSGHGAEAILVKLSVHKVFTAKKVRRAGWREA
jgi:hypothetical protein